MTSELAKKQCIPSKGDVRSLKGENLEKLRKQLNSNWAVVNDHHLEKEYVFSNFRQALAFTNQVGELAESLEHHPDIYWADILFLRNAGFLRDGFMVSV